MKTTSQTRRDRSDWMEVVATIVLALAAVATAWSSYQATRWNGEQATASSRTNAVRIQAARASSLFEAQAEIDVATFIQWVNAHERGEPDLATFYEDRFRAEFHPAFEAWLATDPLSSPEAPPTPFAMDEYAPAARTEAEQLDEQSEVLSAVVRRNIQRAANYVLAVVLFAVALFFAGMSTKLRGQGTRLTMLVVGCLIFLGAASWIATFPVSFSV
jgi:ferric-dicitrate binding protein FerR (iron transport regulator)